MPCISKLSSRSIRIQKLCNKRTFSHTCSISLNHTNYMVYFLRAYAAPEGTPCFRISAISGDGCRPLVYALQEALDTLAPQELAAESPVDEYFPDDLETD